MSKYVNLIPTLSVKSDGVGKFVRVFHHTLLEHNVEALVLTHDPSDVSQFQAVKLCASSSWTPKFKFSLSLIITLIRLNKANPTAVFHVHGLWMWMNFVALFVPRMKYVYSPHGAISDHTRKNWSLPKRIAFSLVQRAVLNKAILVLASSNLEAGWLVNAKIKREKIRVLPLCDSKPNINAIQKRNSRQNKLSYLYVGRFSPIKNLVNFLEVFQTFAAENHGAKLTLMGNYNNDYGYEIHRRFSGENIIFKGECSHSEISEQLSLTDFLVLPSFSENFSYSALEAAMCGCKLIVSKETPWATTAPSFTHSIFDPNCKDSMLQALQVSANANLINYDVNELLQFSADHFVESLLREVNACQTN